MSDEYPGDLEFQELTDDAVWFANASAFNNWVGNITLKDGTTTGGGTGSAATTTTAGVVKQIAPLTAAYTTPSYGSSYYSRFVIEDPDGTTKTIDAATKAAFDTAIANIAQLKAQIDELKTKMITAGILAT